MLYILNSKGVNINVYIQHSQEATIRSGWEWLQKLMAKLNTYGDFNSSLLLINVAASLPCNYTLI